MNCPHCQKVLPEKYNATYCPFCGLGITFEEKVSVIKQPSIRPIPIRWPVFFGVLLAPPLLTLLTSFLVKGQDNQPISPGIAFFGGIAAGIACGIMLGLHVGKTAPARLGFGLLFSGIFAVVCVALSFFGCMAGGYEFRLH
jgi:hypothetical protein